MAPAITPELTPTETHLRRVHLMLPYALPAGALQAEMGASVATLCRAGLLALEDLHRRAPRRARRLIASAEVRGAR